MSRIQKQHCSNCPARNNRVTIYDVPLNGRTVQQRLCQKCAAILNKILREESAVPSSDDAASCPVVAA